MPRSQLHLFSTKKRKALGWDGQYGGDSRPGLRNIARPLDESKHLHLVLRSELARGERSMLHRRNRSRVAQVVYRHARAKGILVVRFENVGNHLHLLIRIPSRQAFQAFLKGLSGVIARLVTGIERGTKAAKTSRRRFWDRLAYSRVVSWGRELKAVRAYFDKNRLEAIGFRGAYLKITPAGRPVVVIGDPALFALARGRPWGTAVARGRPVDSPHDPR